MPLCPLIQIVYMPQYPIFRMRSFCNKNGVLICIWKYMDFHKNKFKYIISNSTISEHVEDIIKSYQMLCISTVTQSLKPYSSAKE